MNKLNTLTIKEAREGLLSKKFSSLELTTACLSQIARIDKKINAFVTVCREKALEAAKEADRMIKEGKTEKKLLGIPVGIKDSFCIKGVRTTASSKVLDNFISPYSSTVWERLEKNGAVLIGKTNMDAWAHGSSTETSDYGTTLNPWDTTKLPGGSSGGSAACTAADEVIASIGSETAGSIRGPASWCGVVGLKPTYGRVSRYGVVAMGSSFDSPGPITKSVYDSALMLSVIAGKDPMDATTLPSDQSDFEKNLDTKKEFTIGFSSDYFENVDPDVKNKVMEVIENLEKQGFKTKEIKLFPPKYAIAVYTILQRCEVSSNLARYDGIRYGNGREFFGQEAKRRIMLGTYALMAGYYDEYYKKAQKVRTLIVNDFDKAFKEVDVIIAPTLPTVALPVGASCDQAMFGEMADVLLEPSSIAGLCGISIPVGKTNNLPIGVQIIGPQKEEEIILQIATFVEKLVNFKRDINI